MVFVDDKKKEISMFSKMIEKEREYIQELNKPINNQQTEVLELTKDYEVKRNAYNSEICHAIPTFENAKQAADSIDVQAIQYLKSLDVTPP